MPRIGMLLKKKRGFAALIEECGDYLATGDYHVTRCFNKMAIKRGCFEPGNLKNWYFQAIFGTFHVNNKQGYANCNKALLSVVKNYKMFDEQAGRVYTRYTERFWRHAILFYEKMSGDLPSTILSVDRERRVIVERFITEPVQKDAKKCFETFCHSYMEYMKVAAIERRVAVPQLIDEMRGAAVPPDIRSYLDAIERVIAEDETEYPFIICHNDVNINNLLTGDNEAFYLTDFELCEVNAFFFDVFGLVFNSAAFQGNDSLLEPYFTGAFDGALAALFDEAGMAYQPTRKKEYACLFLYLKIRLIQQWMPELLGAYSGRIAQFLTLLG